MCCGGRQPPRTFDVDRVRLLGRGAYCCRAMENDAGAGDEVRQRFFVAEIAPDRCNAPLFPLGCRRRTSPEEGPHAAFRDQLFKQGVADTTACTGDSDHVARVQWHPLRQFRAARSQFRLVIIAHGAVPGGGNPGSNVGVHVQLLVGTHRFTLCHQQWSATPSATSAFSTT